MSELDDKLALLVDALLENQPRKTSIRFDEGLNSTILAGNQLTVTFTINKDQYEVRLLRAYADARIGCTYNWIINGVSRPVNQKEYPFGTWVHSDIVLIIGNPTLLDVVVGYYIQGWGDLKTGG
jgi:hypothetical protein